VVIKSAANAFVSEDLLKKQWKAHNYLQKPDFEEAVKEYDAFVKLLKAQGASVLELPFDRQVTIDSIYCRDASIATDFGMIICNMGKPERKLEPESQYRFFLQKGIPVLGRISSPGTLEGGDVAWIDARTLAVGHSYRSNAEGIAQLRAMLEPRGVEVLEVDLPHYKGPSDVFHLMSIFSPVDEKLAVIYAPLMPVPFIKELRRRGFRFAEVPDDEFETMGCNVLALQPGKCLLLDGNPMTRAALESNGCEVITYRGDNISIFGGGGPTCLTRPLDRTL